MWSNRYVPWLPGRTEDEAGVVEGHEGGQLVDGGRRDRSRLEAGADLCGDPVEQLGFLIAQLQVAEEVHVRDAAAMRHTASTMAISSSVNVRSRSVSKSSARPITRLSTISGTMSALFWPSPSMSRRSMSLSLESSRVTTLITERESTARRAARHSSRSYERASQASSTRPFLMLARQSGACPRSR
jgi:hypothetical protein